MAKMPLAASGLTVLSLLLLACGREMYGAESPANPGRRVQIGGSPERSQVPPPLRQGVFLSPQSVSALDVSDDGSLVAVGTMAFRHDRNFWLLSAETGDVRWARYLETWGPSRVAVLSEGKGFAVGLTYGFETVVASTVGLFQGEKDKVLYAYDRPLLGGRRWLRYGGGDWRTGWPASVPGDLLTRAGTALFASANPDRNQGPGSVWKYEGGGRQPVNVSRPFRMAASADGKVVAFGYPVHDFRGFDPQVVKRFDPAPPGMVAVWNAAEHEFAKTLWTAEPTAATPAVPRPPEASTDFAPLAEAFNMKPLGVVPFRIPMSVAVNGDGSKVAVTEYGGHARVGRERILPDWSPLHPISFCPRQRGLLRVFTAPGKEVVSAQLPRAGLFKARIDRAGEAVWCAPMSWFARGIAGCPWLPADADADTLFVYDIARKNWHASWRFPDAVSGLAIHPDGTQALVCCWDGRLYLLNRDADVQARVQVGSPARLRWSADGRFAVAAAQDGSVRKIDREGKVGWTTQLPVAPLPLLAAKDFGPVFKEVPVYSVGRCGPEQAYVGDIWLIKAPGGAILVDAGGTSAIPVTRQKIQAAGVDPKEVRYVLLSHSHGDHAGSAYLWRAAGAKVVAPASAAFALTWMMPTWSDYNLWPPCAIDVPLDLKRAGDETEVTLCGVKVKAIFAPGHTPDSVVYVMELSGKRVIFTGDIAFDDRRRAMPLGSNIVHRCYGNTENALSVINVIQNKVLPLKPDFDFKGHRAHANATAVWQRILQASRADLQSRGQDR